eukprot:1367993-Rhodomonas_salina.1
MVQRPESACRAVGSRQLAESAGAGGQVGKGGAQLVLACAGGGEARGAGAPRRDGRGVAEQELQRPSGQGRVRERVRGGGEAGAEQPGGDGLAFHVALGPAGVGAAGPVPRHWHLRGRRLPALQRQQDGRRGDGGAGSQAAPSSSRT